MMPPNSLRIYDYEPTATIYAMFTNDDGEKKLLLMDWMGKVKGLFTNWAGRGIPTGARRRYFRSLPPEARRAIRINTTTALFGEP
jgi:hypothetical protein